MKKRILASLLSFCLLVGLLPTAAMAADEQELTGGDPAPVCICEALCTENGVNQECSVCAADFTVCAYQGTPSGEGDTDGASGTEDTTDPVAAVQALIDALPSAEDITADNADEVSAQLEAIDKAVAALTEEDAAALNRAKYIAAAEALAALGEPDDAPEAVVPSYTWYTEAGEGAEEYTLATVADLLGFANIVNGTELPEGIAQFDFAGKTVLLGGDMDLTDVAWTPIDGGSGHRFAGTFDGQGNTISNLTLTAPEDVGSSVVYLSFFAYTSACTIRNVVMDQVNIDGISPSSERDIRAAALVGNLGGTDEYNSTLENIKVSNVTIRNCKQAAGLVFETQNGTQEAPVRLINCDADHVSIYGSTAMDTFSAGMCYQAGQYSQISGCDVSDILLRDAKDSAGIFRNVLEYSSMKDCTAIRVTVDSDRAKAWGAGMASMVYVGGTIENCMAKDIHLNVQTYASGLIRYSFYDPDELGLGGTMKNCSVENVEINSPVFMYFSGLSEKIYPNATIENCLASGVSVSSTNIAMGGGLFHTVSGQSQLKNCAAKGITISGEMVNAGGLVYSALRDSKVTDCSAEDIIITSQTTLNFGGLSQQSTGVIFEGCWVRGVSASAQTVSGAGFIKSSTDNSFTNCFAEDITATASENANFGGGFVGGNSGANSYSGCSSSDVSIMAGKIETFGGFSGFSGEGNSYRSCSAKNISFTSIGDMLYVGGFSGGNNKAVTYQDCIAKTIKIATTSAEGKIGQVGGFTGSTQNGDNIKLCTFQNCIVSGLDMKFIGTGDSLTGAMVGGFSANFTNGTRAENCSVSGTIDAQNCSDLDVGGFLGNLGCAALTVMEVKNCTVDVDIRAKDSAGGFIGSSALNCTRNDVDVAAKFENCTATGSVTSTDGAAGGFVGDGNRGTYTNCTTSGSVSGVTAGGFWGSITPNPNKNTDNDVNISGCEASGTVLGSENAGGFIGNATTASGIEGEVTSVTVSGSTASLTVVGTSKDTVVNGFLNSTTPNDGNISLGTGDANTEAKFIVTPKVEGETITQNENGDLVIPSGGATITDGGVQKDLPGGSMIHEDCTITIPAGESFDGTEYPNGAIVKPDGTVREKSVLTLSTASGTVKSNIGKFTFTYTYNGDGAVSVSSSDDTVATATVDAAAKTVTVTVLKAGSSVLTLNAAETDKYSAAEAKYELTVEQYTGGGSTGGSSSPSYAITVDAGKDGEVTVSPKRAEKGDTVTITVKPDEGYELNELTVTDSKGNELKLTDKGDGKFTFTMPGGKVEIEASFVKSAWENPFMDVADGAWYAGAVQYVYEKGLMAGTGEDTFAPDLTTTRGMLVTILYRLEGSPKVSGSSMFNDVAEGDWYTDAIKWAASEGIAGGYGNGKFGPNDPITREQLASILWRYAGSPAVSGMALNEFTDHAAISSYAVEAMRWAVSEGLIAGTGSNTLAPQGNATRAQVATILMRYAENLTK